MSSRLIKALIFKGTDYSEDYFEYIKLSQFMWVQFANTADGNILYYMCLNDSLIYNTMAQHILNKYINGTVLCIKLSKSVILDISVTDIPLLVDNLLAGYFNSINLTDKSSNILTDKSSNILTDKSSNILTDKSSNILTDKSSNILTDKTNNKEIILDTDMKEPYDTDYTNSTYYDYHTGYNS